ncbi:MAG: sialidase family protein [Planctomycetota bacterium]|nr:sialidase family protein [Planctomycetota bacterium]
MRLHIDRPVTIESVRFAERWFPYLHRMPDGMLLLGMQHNTDTHFSPWHFKRSVDGGRTWTHPADNVPRLCWWHGFADGELFEIDTYGVQDPASPGEAVYHGAWSHPGRPNDVPRLGLVRVRSTQRGLTLREMPGLPKHPWWPLWNQVHGGKGWWGEMMGLDAVRLSGPYFTDIVDLGGERLLAVGYFDHVGFYESRDRGQTWDEVGVIHPPAGAKDWAANESALRRLADGRLYVVMRVEGSPWGVVGQFHHAWSSDEGRTWSQPEPLALEDEPAHRVGCAWPRLAALADGTLALAYGRPGKNLVFDPTGTGKHWGGRLDLHAWELDTQTHNGVPADQRLRGILGVDWTRRFDRHTDSGDYLGVVATDGQALLVVYDVHSYVENWNAHPISGVRMVRVTLDG